MSWSKNGAIEPQIAWKVNFLVYPETPSYKQFLGPEADSSPEGAIAHYVQTISQGPNAFSPESLNAARRFYDSKAYAGHDDWTSDSITSGIESSAKFLKNNLEVRFWHRYDVGQVSFITLGYAGPDKFRFWTTIRLHKVGDSYLIVPNGILISQTLQTLTLLVYLNDSNMIVNTESLDAVPLPTYEYHFTLQNSFPGETSTESPCEILFNGRLSNIPIIPSMVPDDSVQAFLKRFVVGIFQGQGGNAGQLFGSNDWTDQDAYIPPADLTIPALPPIRTPAPEDQMRIVFTIDFPVESMVFVRIGNSKKMERVVVWKQSVQPLRHLTPRQTIVTEDPFPGNLESLFQSSEFQSYLGAKVDQFTNANDRVKIPTH